MTAIAPALTAERNPVSRLSIPVGHFSIPLGLAGLGGAWAVAAEDLGVSSAPAEAAFAVATIVWTVFTLLYVTRTLTSPDTSFTAELRHPLAGPLTAYPPIVAILLAAHYQPWLGAAAAVLVTVAIAALALNIAQLIARWLTQPLDHDALHPGYFLPLTAGPSIAAIGLSSIGMHQVAVAAFGVGIVFWFLFGAVIMGRLMVGGPLPSPFIPVLSVLVSPPLTAGVAWFAIQDGRIDAIQQVLGGVSTILLLVQILLIPRYLRVPFSIQHWAFTFPLAVTGNIVVRWAHATQFPGWQIIAWTALAVTTAAILAILGATIRAALDAMPVRRRRRPAGRPAAF